MIKIKKDVNKVPASLNNKTTNQRRQELIANKAYIHERKYNARYKTPDVKVALKKLYNGKCGFCEQKIEVFQVEHFRPKSIYYWLAYSWDNLLVSCPRCNVLKKDKFSIKATSITTQFDINKIHNLAEEYAKQEQNELIHPEIEDNFTSLFEFNDEGEISATDKRAKYTIEICGLNRIDLQEYRRQILSNLVERIYDRRFDNRKSEKFKKESVTDLIKDFVKEAYNPKNEFLAFRQYILKNKLIPLKI